MIGLDKEYNLKFEYLGQVKNKKRDGRGKCFWEYNLMYEGYFKKGNMQGVGRLLDTRSAGKKLILEGFWTN